MTKNTDLCSCHLLTHDDKLTDSNDGLTLMDTHVLVNV